MYLIILSLILILACTPPPSIFVDRDRIVNKIDHEFLNSIKGYGKVSAKINGENLEGSFDMLYKPDSIFNITFYTDFGNIVGFIKANKDSGIINLGGKEKKISLFDNLALENTILFNISLINTVKILSEEIIFELTQKKPVEIKEKGNRIFYIWKKDNNFYSGIFSKKSGAIKSFVIEYFDDKNKTIIKFEKFYGDFARILSFYIDGQNYFYLSYENIKRITR